jgi:hypothetical protein
VDGAVAPARTDQRNTMNATDEGAPQRLPTLGFRKLMIAMAAFVVIGTPLVYFLWTALNDVLTGRFDGRHLAFAAPALILFVVLLRYLARAVRRWENRHIA